MLHFFLKSSEPLLKLFFPRVDFNTKWFRQYKTGYLWCFSSIWQRNILRLARPMPWPCALNCWVGSTSCITFNCENLDNFQSPGTYFQCGQSGEKNGQIFIGRGTLIAPNVGIITVNHDPLNIQEHLKPKDVVIGDGCWIGMNSVILPGVHLADFTIVAAGAVVTKSFLQAGQTLAGVPARPLKR